MGVEDVGVRGFCEWKGPICNKSLLISSSLIHNSSLYFTIVWFVLHTVSYWFKKALRLNDSRSTHVSSWPGLNARRFRFTSCQIRFQIIPVHGQFRFQVTSLVHIGSGFRNYESCQFKFSISVQVLVHKVPEPILSDVNWCEPTLLSESLLLASEKKYWTLSLAIVSKIQARIVKDLWKLEDVDLT